MKETSWSFVFEWFKTIPPTITTLGRLGNIGFPYYANILKLYLWLRGNFKTRSSVPLASAPSLPFLVPQSGGCVDIVDISFGESIGVSQELRKSWPCFDKVSDLVLPFIFDEFTEHGVRPERS